MSETDGGRSGNQDVRRVLLVTYYFPPSGGSGVQRSLKFTRYLPDFGWIPTVVTVRPEQASYPDLDPDLSEEIPLSVEVERTPAWDPYALYATLLQKEKRDVVSVGFLGEAETNLRQRIARWIRANVFLPDARVGWVPFAAVRGHELLRRSYFDAVLTTGPPHSAHLVGLILKLIHARPWLVDFRDPWTEIDYYSDLPMTAAARAVDAWLERLVLKSASAGTVVSESMGRQLLQTAPIPLKVIQNGFDPADFQGGEAAPTSENFVLAHIGNLNLARNPVALWQAVYELRSEGNLERFRLSFTGNVEPSVLAGAEKFGLGDVVEVLPYVPHDRAVERMKQSSMLLLSINRVMGAEGIVTGKLYEYVASGRPVLGVGPPAGDAASVLGESDAGRMFDFDDVEGIKAYLGASYHAWATGHPLKGATAEAARRYSRREQTAALAMTLDSLVGRRPSIK